MGEFDLETVVLDIVRKKTAQPSAGPRSRFVEDLGLSENGRNALFAFLVEAFTARGLNLPSRGFFLTNFLACATPAEVHSAIKDALAGVKKRPTTAGTPPAKPQAAAPVAGIPAAPPSNAKSKPKAPKKAPAGKGRKQRR